MKRFLSITAAGLLLVSQSVLAGGNVEAGSLPQKIQLRVLSRQRFSKSD
jgi:hypothetical protein